MGMFSNNKKEVEEANNRIIELLRENEFLRNHLNNLSNSLVANNANNSLKNDVDDLIIKKKQLEAEISMLDNSVQQKRKEYIELDDVILLQEFGLYKPQYNFATSSLYKDKLNEIREKQSKMIKLGTAATCSKRWVIENSVAKGEKFTEDNIKQILKTFNNECENSIMKVKFNNIESIKKRITLSYNSLNRLNSTNKVSISEEFLYLKYQEMYLAYEYAQKIQEEKEELRIQRELHREELRVAKELEEKRLEIEKEKQHYANVLNRITEQLNVEKDLIRKQLLVEKKEEIENNLTDLDMALKDVDYREANQRAGYVYIISNIGAFGKDIYKIGMTRRLEPQDRVDELGSASVPFKFDVHAFIFSDDAPKLENALHKAFKDKKINLMNNRKEFFHVSLEEIEKVVRENYDRIVDFKYIADAQQYRETLMKREMIINEKGSYNYE